jgi:hypothetical protein
MYSTIRQPTTTPCSKKLNKTSIVVQPSAAAPAPPLPKLPVLTLQILSNLVPTENKGKQP